MEINQSEFKTCESIKMFCTGKRNYYVKINCNYDGKMSFLNRETTWEEKCLIAVLDDSGMFAK